MTPAVALLCLTAAGDGDVTFFEAFEALPGDAGVPDAGWLEPKREVAAGFGLRPDAGWEEVGPGCFVEAPICIDKGKRGAQLEAELQELRGSPHDFGLGALFKAGWVGFALGALSALIGLAALCWGFTGNVLCR